MATDFSVAAFFIVKINPSLDPTVVVDVVRVIGVLGVVEIAKATAGVCGVHASSQAVNLASYSLTVMPNTFVNAAT
jgi:hypothetical protein